MVIQPSDNVAELADGSAAIKLCGSKTSLRGRAAWNDANDQRTCPHALRLTELIGGDLHTHERPAHLLAASSDQLRDRFIDLIDRDGEADARAGLGRAVDRRVDADKPACAVDERST